jgi:hypothetical protein
MAFTQKSSSVSQRDEGEFPQLPEQAEPQMQGWWSNTVAVLDRVRDKIEEIEGSTGAQGPAGPAGPAGPVGPSGVSEQSTEAELKAILNIQGDAVGTLNTQELYSKTMDGGLFSS